MLPRGRRAEPTFSAAFTWPTCPGLPGRADGEETVQQIDNDGILLEAGRFLKGEIQQFPRLTSLFTFTYSFFGRRACVQITPRSRTTFSAVLSLLCTCCDLHLKSQLMISTVNAPPTFLLIRLLLLSLAEWSDRAFCINECSSGGHHKLCLLFLLAFEIKFLAPPKAWH